MSSQRHKLLELNVTAAGEIIAEGEIAPGYLQQLGNPDAFDGTYLKDADLAVDVPMGPPGGPLQGSSIAGPIPEGIEPPSPPDPEPGEEPTITSLDPATAVLGSADITMIVNGTNFTNSSVIHFSDQDEPTTFISDTQISTGVKPSLGWGAVSVPVTVKQGSYETDPVQFTFSESDPVVGTASADFANGQEDIALPDYSILPVSNVQGSFLTLDGPGLRAVAEGDVSAHFSFMILHNWGKAVVFGVSFDEEPPQEMGRKTVESNDPVLVEADYVIHVLAGEVIKFYISSDFEWQDFQWSDGHMTATLETA